jgi:hypothetical protein
MCTVSAMGDEWGRTFPDRWPNVYPSPNTSTYIVPISREEFEALKSEVEALKRLLQEAKAFDEATGQPDCEMDEKVALIRKVAEFVGVDLEDVFG